MSNSARPLVRLLARQSFAAQAEVVARLRQLPLEQALELLAEVLQHERASQVRRAYLVSRGAIILLAITVALTATQNYDIAWIPIVLLVLWGAGSLSQLRATVRWRNARTATLDLLSRVNSPEHCGVLLDLAAPLEKLPAHWPGRTLRSEIELRLTQLLPRLDPEAALQLTPKQRAQLRIMLERLRHHPDTLVAILLALGSAQDTGVIVDARLLVVNHPSDRVRAAARECLLELSTARK